MSKKGGVEGKFCIAVCVCVNEVSKDHWLVLKRISLVLVTGTGKSQISSFLVGGFLKKRKLAIYYDVFNLATWQNGWQI